MSGCSVADLEAWEAWGGGVFRMVINRLSFYGKGVDWGTTEVELSSSKGANGNRPKLFALWQKL